MPLFKTFSWNHWGDTVMRFTKLQNDNDNWRSYGKTKILEIILRFIWEHTVSVVYQFFLLFDEYFVRSRYQGNVQVISFYISCRM